MPRPATVTLAEFVAVDPGERTGIAHVVVETGPHRVTQRRLVRLLTVARREAAETIRQIGCRIVVVEDTRAATLYARNRAGTPAVAYRRARSVGALDQTIKDLLADLTAAGIDVRIATPRGAKWSADTLRDIWGWEGRTSQHARDAARLAWNWWP